jgi:hypothetical protein
MKEFSTCTDLAGPSVGGSPGAAAPALLFSTKEGKPGKWHGYSANLPISGKFL